ALWELAGALVTIERARTAQRRMAAALTCPSGDGTLAGDLRCRHALLSRVRRRARAEALHHLATLCALADTGAPDGRPP
ncbi:MAG TPA: hypothetical protein VJT31_01035, partial [Rugosimonospora sp.]|nr:hypothetical protein [Rugosimonospora sp.]